MNEHGKDNFLGTGLTEQQAMQLGAVLLASPALPEMPNFDSATKRLGLESVALVLAVNMKLHTSILGAAYRDENPWPREIVREVAFMIDNATVRTLWGEREYEEWKQNYQRYIRGLKEHDTLEV